MKLQKEMQEADLVDNVELEKYLFRSQPSVKQNVKVEDIQF